jgi:hypothetical protein
MTTKITDLPIDAEREREIMEARVAVLRRAKEQGVKPFSSLQDFANDTELSADFEVDEFLRQVREDRNRPSTRKAE